MRFLYEINGDEKYIVGVEAITASLDNAENSCPIDVKKAAMKIEQDTKTITYTYSVSWHEVDSFKCFVAENSSFNRKLKSVGKTDGICISLIMIHISTGIQLSIA